MDDKQDFCGICAANVPGENVNYDLYQMLSDIQHRGQAGAGISTFNPERAILLRTYKRTGQVKDVFGGDDEDRFQKIMDKFRSSLGIGHNRYGTSGSLTTRHVQPFERTHGIYHKWFSFGFNGHIANRKELEKQIKKVGFHLMLDTDTEIMMHYISKFISDSKGDLKDVFGRLAGEFDGAYNIVFLNAKGEQVATRDPWGIRPLSSIVTERGAFVSSETCALYRHGTENIRHIKPGEMAILKDGEITYKKYCNSQKKALCFFEYIYFAAVTSNIDGRSVYNIRKRCGEELAKLETQEVNEKDWVVIPVPNTARPIANSYAKALGLPQIYDEGLIASGKGRTFIDEGDRSMKVKRKFLPIPSVIRGKKVIVIDDSIVRSTTMATLVKYHLKKLGGAKEVHVRIAAPPIIAPCYYGIDMRSFDELIASTYQGEIHNGVLSEKAQEEIAGKINVDSLIYMTHEGLVSAIGADREDLCMACINREYPTPAGQIHDEENHKRYRDLNFCGKIE